MVAYTFYSMTAEIGLQEAYQEYVDREDEEFDLEYRTEKSNTLQNLLSEDNLEDFGSGELRQLVRHLWAYHGWTNKDYIVDEMLEDGEVNVVNSLKRSLHSEDAPGERFETLERNINMMGPAAATEILTFMYPKKCAIFNQRAEEALERLGYSAELPSRMADGDDYEVFLSILNDLQQNIESENVKNAGRVRDFIDLDYFLYHVSQMDLDSEKEGGHDEEEEELDHDTVQQMLIEIGDGLGFDVEDEYDAGPRARIDVRWSTRVANLGVISYAFEVHHKGSPDSAILNLKKAEAADPSVQKSVIVSKEDDLKKFREEIDAMGGDFTENVSYLTPKRVSEAENLLSELKEFLRDAGLMDDLPN